MNFPALGPDKVQDHRTMLWTSVAPEPSRAYAIFWRAIDEHIDHNSVHFSSYGKEYFGFARCLKVD